ncbi:hypothetical protein [Curtobacterium sp. MCJR17_043]|uniref:hypothetical protein n=1 Tax=Curtobacterium sp. MCJR17_043 TaxID=2175660 RepID=UPI0024E004D4|nr:hypothetical protein [Curtobacterium sp. MCJR17_043]WIB35892.1 hypothetical protein DEJ15_00775 [Curtobacterium sp. MCJR17_043]
MINGVGVDSASPLEPYAQTDAPLQGRRVATLTLDAISQTLPTVPDWLESVRSLDGFVDANVNSVTLEETSGHYTVNMTIHVDERAFDGKYLPQKKGGNDMTRNRLNMVLAVLAMVVVAAAGFFLGVQPQLSRAATDGAQQATVEHENAVKSGELARLRQQAKTLPEMRTALAELQASVPSSDRMSAFYDEVDQAATTAGVTVSTITTSDATAYIPPVTEAASTATDGAEPAAPSTTTPHAVRIGHAHAAGRHDRRADHRGELLRHPRHGVGGRLVRPGDVLRDRGAGPVPAVPRDVDHVLRLRTVGGVHRDVLHDLELQRLRLRPRRRRRRRRVGDDRGVRRRGLNPTPPNAPPEGVPPPRRTRFRRGVPCLYDAARARARGCPSPSRTSLGTGVPRRARSRSCWSVSWSSSAGSGPERSSSGTSSSRSGRSRTARCTSCSTWSVASRSR